MARGSEHFPELSVLPVTARRIAYEKNLTMREAIDRSGTSPTTWWAALAREGGRKPSLEMFFSIAYGLGITPERLIAEMRKDAGIAGNVARDRCPDYRTPATVSWDCPGFRECHTERVMRKERYLVEVRTDREDGWKAIHACKSMEDAVPVADAAHNLSFLFDKPLAVRIRERRDKGLED